LLNFHALLTVESGFLAGTGVGAALPRWSVGDEALAVDARVEATAVTDVDDTVGADELDGPDPLLHPAASTTGSGTASSIAAARRGGQMRVRTTAVI
jgi:hypothetical protein